MKSIPLIIPVFNQLTFTRNLINQFRFYYPENPVFIIDNNSTYPPMVEFLKEFEEKNYMRIGNHNLPLIYRNAENNFIPNLTAAIKDITEKWGFEYYVISDSDISIHPSTPSNFLDHFRALIDKGYHRAGFNLITDNLPAHLNKRSEILYNEGQFRATEPVVNVKGFPGYRAPIDTTFCMYTTKNSGWHAPMDGKDWGNCVRLFEVFHLTWHLGEEINEEMDFYFKNCKKHVAGAPSAGSNNNSPVQYKDKVEYCTSNILINPALSQGAILNEEFEGFKTDYLVLHCLLRQYKPGTVWETGTNTGSGTKIITNAVPLAAVFSLDLPIEESDAKERTGKNCDLPFTQLFGDSMTFNYANFPCEAYFIDGAHTFEHVLHETTEILKLKPKLMIYHDSDLKCVFDAIVKGFEDNDDYILTRVIDSRIFYAVRK